MIELRSAPKRIRIGIGKCLLLVSLGSLGACASFSAMPEPVLTTQDVLNITADYPVNRALRLYHAPTDAEREGLSPRHWRDMVVGVYMAAADARYQEFRANLSREMRGGNFGLDLAVLGLSGAGTVSGQGTANVLAAITGALTGTRSALSKDVYFEQALPALVAGMEAARIEVATRILTGLAKPVDEYPLERAITDVLAYERAASLDQAIQRVTVQAAADQARQQANYDTIQHVAGIIPPENVPLARKVADNITRLMRENKSAEIANILRTLNFPVAGTIQEQARRALQEVGLRAERGTLPQFVADVRTQHGLELGQ